MVDNNKCYICSVPIYFKYSNVEQSFVGNTLNQDNASNLFL